MKKIRFILSVFLACNYALASKAESPMYWIQLTDKQGTPYTLSEPQEYLSARALSRRNSKGVAIDSTDLPVNPSYVDSIRKIGFSVKFTSRWMNGVIASLPDSITADSLVFPSFVSSIELRKPQILSKNARQKFEECDSLSNLYGNSYTQVSMMNGHLLHKYSKGSGVHIAILDAGFLNANKIKAFDSVYNSGRVLGTFDFANPGGDVYTQSYHGCAVFSLMAANLPGELIGTAPEASYWLLRTEESSTEYPVEEDFWIVAAEFADSAGCDVINTSLGYSEFDDSSFDHTYSELDGKTLRIAKAANLAVEKGIVVVCSAGNDGSTTWKYIATPADAEKVLTVAAVDYNGTIANFSSYGFGDSLHSLKPDAAAMGVSDRLIGSSGTLSYGSGTSFSSPLLAGLTACFIALSPTTPASEIIRWVKAASSLYPTHDVQYGYGIPDFAKLLEEKSLAVSKQTKITEYKAFPNPFTSSLTFNFEKNTGELSIFNMQGEVVIKHSFEKQSSLYISSEEISGLGKGVYFAQLKSNNIISTIKLVKQ